MSGGLRNFSLICALFLTAGCSMEGMVDSISRQMPVLGERCEHWHCMTPEARDKSEGVKQTRMPPPRPAPGQVQAQPVQMPPQPTKIDKGKDQQGYIDPRSAPPIPRSDDDDDSFDPHGFYNQ